MGIFGLLGKAVVGGAKLAANQTPLTREGRSNLDRKQEARDRKELRQLRLDEARRRANDSYND